MRLVAERWTPERRRQHTRDLLLDAAAEVFARRGFEGASLDEIAETAGYTRGAIYKNFGSKAELFLATTRRFNERLLQTFLEAIDPTQPVESLDLSDIAKRWREMVTGNPRQHALAAEFNLYVLRNPEVRERVADQRRGIAEMIARFVEEQAADAGISLRIPPLTLARMALAASYGLEMASVLDPDEEDLFEPFLTVLVTAWEDQRPAEPEPKAPARRGKGRAPR